MLQNPKDVTSLSNLALNTRVRAYYHRPRFHLSESDQNLLRRPLTVILMRSLSKKRAWLRVADTRSSIYRREHDNTMRSVPTLEAFFDTINPPSPYHIHSILNHYKPSLTLGLRAHISLSMQFVLPLTGSFLHMIE